MARQARVSAFEQIHIRLGNIRLVLAAIAALLAWLVFAKHLASPWWLLAPAALFVPIAAYHAKILRLRDFAQRAVAFYEQGIARLEDRWNTVGETGIRFADPHHVYSGDLDLFGPCSLFQLLSTARTRMGESELARWLLAPAEPTRIRERQACVAELRDQLDLREDLAVLGADAGVGVHPADLLRWADSPNPLLKFRWVRALAVLLASLTILAAGAWAFWGIVSPLLLSLLIDALLARLLRQPVDEALHATEHAFLNLDLLSAVMARIEEASFAALPLKAIQQDLSSQRMAASQAIARLRTLVDLIDSRDNLFLRILNVPLLYSVQVAFAAAEWREKHGSALSRWLNAVGEMEAILSLSSYSFEHPTDPFPQFVDSPSCFDAELMGHPLLPSSNCVRNSLRVSAERPVLLVSGSNMSGKSTLLRAVGLNTVLAMAGAPVRATHLRLTPLQVGASIRINDSLQEGSSRFYAEITRLRQILDLGSGSPPLLFLLDELLQGTNSNDRRIGAEGVIRALLERGAIGLVSTHDLALTEVGGPANSYLHNVHFQDELQDGRMKFDYQLREGVVTKSNGLELMRSIGLRV
jgi:MutS domain V